MLGRSGVYVRFILGNYIIMNTLKTIRDADFGIDTTSPASFRERRAARAVVVDADGNVAIIHAKTNDYHKLPGGGIDEGEQIEDALARELMEEIGCVATPVRELGIIEEYRNEHELNQLSYCFLANLVGGKGTPTLEDSEIAEGFETVWMSIEEAITAFEADEADMKNYSGKFMCLRDLTFLREAQKHVLN